MAPRARILAIDDQLYFRSFLEGLLAEEGFVVETFAGLSEADDRLRRPPPPDALIVDPGASGADAARVIAGLRRHAPEAPLIVLSGVGDVETVAGAMRAGAAEYLPKPVERSRLLEALNRVLGARTRRGEREQLVEENLEFMSRVSLHERALPLLTAATLEEASEGVLELLAVEAGAVQGALWLLDPVHTQMRVVATRSLELEADASWRTGDPARDARIAAGELVQLSGPRGAAVAVAPILHEGDELAVVRLVGTRPFPPSALELPLKLAGAVLSNAVRFERLTHTSLLDPGTGLPSRTYLEQVLAVEVQKAQRFGRRLACLCLELKGVDELEGSARTAMVGAVRRTLRTTDILASQGSRRFWVLVTDTDSLGGVVLKRRLAERVSEALASEQLEATLGLGVASYPLDGETCEDLMREALERVATEHVSETHELGIEPSSSLADIHRRLLQRAEPAPTKLVAEAAELLIGELTCRPRDRGLLFVAPGPEALSVLGPLAALGDADTSTEVFIATDGDTLPSGASVTAVALPPQFDPDDTWMVRFGEAPPYALVAGAPRGDGTRPVFQTGDPVLVEHITFRLRAAVGFGAHH